VRSARLLAIAVALVLVAPAVAQASSPVSRHLADARSALAAARGAALDGRGPAVSNHVTQALHSARLARKAANALASRKDRARALQQVAAFDDAGLGAFAGLLDRVPVSVQDEVAQGLADSAAARQQVVDLLTQLAVDLPEPMRSELLDAVAGFESDGDIQALLDALASGDLTGSVQELVTQQLDDLSTELNDLLDEFQTFAGQLPPDEAAQLQQAIALLRAELADAGSSLEDLLVAILAGLPQGDLGSLCELLGQLPVQLPIDFCPAT
jgi:hypothetical protein